MKRLLSRYPRLRRALLPGVAVLTATAAAAGLTALAIQTSTSAPPAAGAPQSHETGRSTEDIDLSHFRLTFDDEFNYLSVSAVSPKLSSTWYLYPPYGAAGNYSDSHWSTSMLSVDRGVLSSRVQQNAEGWLSGNLSSVDTEGKGFKERYGYFEARMKMPTSGTGSWPAFWLLSDSAISEVDPKGSPYEEIDVVEWYGVNYTANPQLPIVSQASHNYRFDKTESTTGAPSLYEPSTRMPGGALPWNAFHIYGVDIEPDSVTWYIDGHETNRIRTPSQYLSHPFFLMLDYALGGGYGLGGVEDGSRLEVDWVRAYERIRS